MKECDTNDDGELDRDEWKALSDRSLEAILERHALARGNDDEFIDEFLDMAVIVYDLIDEDMNGTLSKEELVKACGEDEDVIEFVVKCQLQCINQLSRGIWRSLTARPSQHGHVFAEKGLSEGISALATHWLIYAQVRTK